MTIFELDGVDWNGVETRLSSQSSPQPHPIHTTKNMEPTAATVGTGCVFIEPRSSLVKSVEVTNSHPKSLARNQQAQLSNDDDSGPDSNDYDIGFGYQSQVMPVVMLNGKWVRDNKRR